MNESLIVTNERDEYRNLRNAEDMGGTRRIGGRRYDDWPSPDEVD